MTVKRSAFLARTGSLVVAFTVPAVTRAGAQTQPTKPGGPSASETNPVTGPHLPDNVDAWLAVARDGTVAVKFGKVELGTGIATAIAQIVADELDVAVDRVRVDDADTADTPDQGYTAGSASLSAGAIPVRQAAAEARLALLALGAGHFGVDAAQLETSDGAVRVRGQADHRAAYGELLAGRRIDRTIDKATVTKSPDAYRAVGRSIPRVDLPGKVYGTYAYLQNLRVPGMLHARVIRPASVGATLAHVDESTLRGIHDARIVRRGDFLAVVAPREWDAIRAMRALRASWTGGGLPQFPDTEAAVKSVSVVSEKAIVDTGDAGALGSGALTATYTWPYQTHGSIGPSCAVADVRDDKATVWSSTQGVFFLRGAIAQLLGMNAADVRVRYVEGSGCYGHNGVDDTAADAALISHLAGAPVRVQYMREQEHGWDPKGGAMVMTHAAALDADKTRIAAWRSDVWSPSHSTRPQGEAGNLLAGKLTGAPAPTLTFVGGDRDAKIDYQVPNYRVTMHNLRDGVLHASAMRGLGGTQNTFANESFMDELAHAAGADPLAFRLAHVAGDPRAVDVLQRVARLAEWKPRAAGPAPARAATLRGRGVAFVHYENSEAYVAAIADVAVVVATGAVHVERIAIAHDCGLIVNPDGLRNQIEGNAIQAMSRALKERVTYDRTHVTSIDWHTYPIARFSEIPQVDIALIDRPHEPIKGAGEATTVVIAPAIANAIFDATGARLRDVPFTPDRVAAAVRA